MNHAEMCPISSGRVGLTDLGWNQIRNVAADVGFVRLRERNGDASILSSF